MSSINLTHHFLIAMPNMADPYFSRTLTYICEHNDQGALGLVVNRPIDMTLQALFERLSLTLRNAYLAHAPIYFGGPVQKIGRASCRERVWMSQVAVSLNYDCVEEPKRR